MFIWYFGPPLVGTRVATLAPLTQAVQGGNVVLLLCLAVLYERYDHGMEGQSCLAFKLQQPRIDVCVESVSWQGRMGVMI